MVFVDFKDFVAARKANENKSNSSSSSSSSSNPVRLEDTIRISVDPRFDRSSDYVEKISVLSRSKLVCSTNRGNIIVRDISFPASEADPSSSSSSGGGVLNLSAVPQQQQQQHQRDNPPAPPPAASAAVVSHRQVKNQGNKVSIEKYLFFFHFSNTFLSFFNIILPEKKTWQCKRKPTSPLPGPP